MKKISLLFLPLFFITFINAQDAEVGQQSDGNQTEDIDPIEKARLAKEAAEKAAAEAEAANEAALEAAAAKAAKEAREKVKRQKEEEEARRAAEKQAAEDAELDAVAKAAAEEAKRKMAEELGLDISDDVADSTESITGDSTQADEEVWTVEAKGPLSGFGLRLNGGYPIYTASKIQIGYESSVLGNFSINTPYGFNAGPLRFSFDLLLSYLGFENKSSQPEFSNFGIYGQLSTSTSELLSFIPAPTEFNLGIGYLLNNGGALNVGGKLGIPLNLPAGIGLGLNGSATISQGADGDGITGWLSAGLELGFNFK